jgi:solute carrier family 25 carnitine/acylcarnitine transporter 20/29
MSSTSSSAQEAVRDEEQVAVPQTNPVSQTLAQIRSFVAGGAGGVCAVVVGHPFDLVKVRMQTAEKGVYSGAIDVVKKTVAREGLARVSHHTDPALPKGSCVLMRAMG